MCIRRWINCAREPIQYMYTLDEDVSNTPPSNVFPCRTGTGHPGLYNMNMGGNRSSFRVLYAPALGGNRQPFYPVGAIWKL